MWIGYIGGHIGFAYCPQGLALRSANTVKDCGTDRLNYFIKCFRIFFSHLGMRKLLHENYTACKWMYAQKQASPFLVFGTVGFYSCAIEFFRDVFLYAFRYELM